MDNELLLQREFDERSLKDFLGKSEHYANCPITDCSGIILRTPKEEASVNEERLMMLCDICHNTVCKRYFFKDPKMELFFCFLLHTYFSPKKFQVRQKMAPWKGLRWKGERRVTKGQGIQKSSEI
jgi:hypothetical protein